MPPSSMRQQPDGVDTAAVWIFGRDERESNYQVHYADERGVSRRYEMSLVGAGLAHVEDVARVLPTV